MLTQVTVSAPRHAVQAPLVLPVGGPSKFPIAFIDGLGPVDSEISTSKYAIVCGEHFEGSRVNMRNIVITLDLKPDYSSGESVEQLRSELYTYFAPKHEVNLEFKSNYGPDRVINGWVESFEAPLFVQDPAVQISVLCPDPYYKASEEKTASVTIQMPNGYMTVMNDGDISNGVVIQASINMSAEGPLHIQNYSTQDQSLQETRFSNFPGGATSFRYDSRSGQKAIVQTSPSSRDLISMMDVKSDWIQIRPGENRIGFTGISQGTSSMSFTFVERYIGL